MLNEFGTMPYRWDVTRAQLSILVTMAHEADPTYLNRVREVLPKNLSLSYDEKYRLSDLTGGLNSWRNNAEKLWTLAPLIARVQFILGVCHDIGEQLQWLIHGLEMMGLPEEQLGVMEDARESVLLASSRALSWLRDSNNPREELTREEVMERLEEDED